jgi:ATP-dependent DNA helicase RecG
MKDFVGLFEDKLSRKQVRFRVEKFVSNKVLEQKGEGSTSIYEIANDYLKQIEVIGEAVLKALNDIENINERAKKGPKKDQ